MCLIAFAIGVSQRWPLVIASNRDEFLERPTATLTRWKSGISHEIISGRDERAGGTWLGITPHGRVAFLTNVREATPHTAPFSRGQLVTRWLEAEDDVAGFSQTLEKENGAYSGFNLVVGDLHHNEWAWMTNKSSDSQSGWHVQSLQSGIYGLSNAALDTPWPKTVELKRVLTTALAEESCRELPHLDTLQKPLWMGLSDRNRAPIKKLPTTGVSLNIENALSSAFVDFPEHAYGTRSSTLVVAKKMNIGNKTLCLDVQVEERTHAHRKLTAPEHADMRSTESFRLNID